MRSIYARLGGRLLFGAALAGLPLSPAQAADHRDAPNLVGDPQADLLDAFAFVNPNNNNVVLAVTANPFIVPGTVQGFGGDVLYQLKVDNDGDNLEDVVIQVTFNKPPVGVPQPPNPQQQVTVVGPVGVRRGSLTDRLVRRTATVPVVTGNIGEVLTGTGPANNIRAFAGLRDDPFFVDFILVLRTLGIQAGAVPTRAPLDFFNGLNCSTIAVEVPAALLTGESGNTIRVWATTSRASSTRRSSRSDDRGATSFVQVERNGLPVINTVLIRANAAARKDEFNRKGPATDRADFRADALAQLVAINSNQAYSEGVVDALLPDVLTLDVTSTAGFLNGRRPQDDIIDAVLNLASNGAIPTDGIPANDVPFLPDFPFFAPPHAPTETIGPRN